MGGVVDSVGDVLGGAADFVGDVVGGVGDFFHMFSLAIKPLRGYLHLHKSFVLSCQKMHQCIRS